MEWYICIDCNHVNEAGDLKRLSELMDPQVPGSWQYSWVCPDCQSDYIEEVKVSLVTDFTRLALNNLKRSGHGHRVASAKAWLETVLAMLEFIDDE